MKMILGLNAQKLCLSVFAILSLFWVQELYAQESEDTSDVKIYVFELHDDIEPNAFRMVKRSVEEAEKINADFIIMDLNTYGGRVDVADSIRTRLMRTTVPTISFVNNNAASAGALISLACDSIYMSSGANIGAATVVDQTGEKAPDKYQSYMRSKMRSTAEEQGRDPQIAEAMVDEHVVIPGIVDDEQILTFTTSEAIENGYSEGKAESVLEIIEDQLGLENYEVVEYKETVTDKIIKFLLNPVVAGVLMFMMIGGIYFEIQTPGVGFPLLAALIGALLYFMPLYLEGLADNWEIALFVVGLILLAIEIFAFPGFGVFGISGIIAILVSLTMSMVDNDFFELTPDGLNELSFPIIRVMITFIITLIAILFLTPVLFKRTRFNHLVLNTTTSTEDGYTVLEDGLTDLVGREGVAFNELRPIGRIEIEDELYDAKSVAGWIQRGEKVKVIQVDINNLIVRKID